MSDDTGWGTQDIVKRFMEEQRKKQKGKYMAVSDESKEMDPKTAYKREQPGDLESSRFWFQCLLIYAACDPQDRGLMLLAAHAITYIESRMDKWGVKPDILYDETEGEWPIYMRPRTGAMGGGDFTDTTRIGQHDTSIGA